MKEENISKVVEKVINNYLDAHSNLRGLFNEYSNSIGVFYFFQKNFNVIFGTMGRLFHENKEEQNHLDSLYSNYLNYIETDYSIAIKKRQLKTYQKRMIVATMIYKLVSNDLTIGDLPIDYTDLENNDGKHWYRGQSDYKWDLTPSMFRNLGNVFSKEITINKRTIENVYAENGMLDKWEKVFKTSKIDYAFLSYMQHSIAYSPLLDFTSDFPTALSFALSNRSAVNDFSYKDSSVFQIEVTNNRMRTTDFHDLPDSFYIDYVPNKYAIGTSILGKTMLTYDDIIEALTPEFVMIDAETNDRMKYQHGKFILFYNYLSLQGTVCTWLNKDLHVTKYRIRKEEKNRWCDKLRKDYPYLMVDKMMDPYRYFSDQ